jgi:hypothetical protein
MIRNFLENVNNRKVIVEKYPQSLTDDFFVMEFNIPKSKRKSQLIVKFKTFSDSIFPNVKGTMLTDKSGQFVINFDPFEIQICSSEDSNSSYEFLKWIDCFKKNKPYSGGANIALFNYNTSKKNPIISLRGCVLENVSFYEGLPFISFKFFSYEIPERDNC